MRHATCDDLHSVLEVVLLEAVLLALADEPHVAAGRLELFLDDVADARAWERLERDRGARAGAPFTPVVSAAAITPTPARERASPLAVVDVNVRGVAVRYESGAPVKVKAPSMEHGEAGGGGEAGGCGGGDVGGDDGGAAPHHVRIIDTSGAVAAGSPMPERTASSSAVDKATSQMSRSRIEPMNMRSPQ